MKPTVRAVGRYFLWLGTVGFGGPIALINYMHRDLVERRRWFTDDEYRDGLTLAQLAPGPMAAQLAIYLGWISAGLRGATVVAIAFVLPSLLMVLALSVLYVRFGGMPWMTGAFYGVGAAVIGIIAMSCLRLARKTVAADPLLWAVFVANAIITGVTASERLSVLLLSGLIVLMVRGGRGWLGKPRALVIAPVLLISFATAPLWLVLFGFFFKASMVVFGSGLAIVPFLYGGVVEQHGWLTDRQFLDAIAVSMITPGPVVITVAFIGYLVAGLGGAGAAALGIFLPVYLFVVLLAPFYDRIRGHQGARVFVQGVTTAAVGAIAGAVYVLGNRAIVDWLTALMAVIAFGLLHPKLKVPEPIIILGAGILGVALRQAV